MKKVSLSDLAQHLGVSKTLISLVLNGKGDQYGINKEVQKKVKEKAIELNYRPNQTARSLRSGKTNTIGLVVDDLSDNYQSNLFKALEAEAYSKGYSLLVTSSKDASNDIITSLIGKSVDGIIFSSSRFNKSLTMLLKNRFLVVSMKSSEDILDSNFVGLDYQKTILENVTYLLGKGHKKVAVAFEKGSSEFFMSEIVKGAKKALVNMDVDITGLIALSFDAKDGNEVSNVLKELKANEPDLKAIISVNDVLTLKLVESINDMGLKIPDEFSVLSLFDHEVFSFTFPKISANETPYTSLAKNSFDLLLKQIGGEQKAAEQVKLTSRFVERASA